MAEVTVYLKKDHSSRQQDQEKLMRAAEAIANKYGDKVSKINIVPESAVTISIASIEYSEEIKRYAESLLGKPDSPSSNSARARV